MRIKRIPRALAHPSTPPPWSQNPPKRPRTRKQYPPALAPIVTPSITSPPGYPRLLASARREPIEPAQWPPSPTIRVGMLDFRYTTSLATPRTRPHRQRTGRSSPQTELAVSGAATSCIVILLNNDPLVNIRQTRPARGGGSQLI